MLGVLLAWWITLPDSVQYALASPPVLIPFIILMWHLRHSKMRHVVAVFYLALLVTHGIPSVQGTTTFVDGDCTNAGNGSVDSCAASPGGAGQFNNLQTALDAQDAPGDTLIIHAANGTEGYVTLSNDIDGFAGTNAEASVNSGFSIKNSGSSTNWIVIKNAPGESPVLRACAEGSTTLAACNRETISMNRQQYIRITDDNSNYADGHIIFYGRIHASGFYSFPAQNMSQIIGPVEFSYTECIRGYGEGDGNWGCFWIIFRDFNFIGGVHHNNMHDITSLTGIDPQIGLSSQSCVEEYLAIDFVIEYNTCNGVTAPTSQAGCWDLKAAPWNNIIRYNICLASSQGVRMGNCTGCPYPTPPGYPSVVTGNEVYGNIFNIAGYTNVSRYPIRFTNGPQYSGIKFYNNTAVGFDACVMSDSIDTPLMNNVEIYNNICAGITNGGNDASGRIVYWMPAAPNLPSKFAYQCDEDTTTNATPYRFGATFYSSLANLQANLPPFGVGSTTTTGSGFGFTNLAMHDYTLTSMSPCRNRGRVGGVAQGAQIDAGAYGVTACVGHLCGGSSDTTPPVISIVTPTSNPTMSTQITPLPTLAGTCTDANGVSTVTWNNNQGGTGTASGTTSWSVSNIPLFSGTNVLTVVCQDLAGNAASDALTVTYTPSIAPGGVLRSRGRIR